MRSRFELIFAATLFIGTYLLAFPFFFLFGLKSSWNVYAYRLNHYWAKVFFFLNGMKTNVIYEEELPKEQYVFCPNHTSALDIAAIPLINEPFTFIGKNEISKIPLFGYMFKKLHISVDRNSLKSRYQTLELSKQAIKSGKNILIFPEGGIPESKPRKLSKFKDGPFRIAIEAGVPIVPITIPFNWIILPDEKILLFKRKGAEIRIIVHKPIPTKGLSLENLKELKMRTFDCIESELKKQANEYR